MKNTLSSLFAAALALLSLTCHGAPTVSLTSPANGAVYVGLPLSITLQASASAEPGRTVVRVEFYANGSLIASDSAAPYRFVWSLDDAGGSIELTAKAIDSEGDETTSAPRTITLKSSNAPPTISLTQPPNNARYGLPVDVTFAVSVRAPEANDSITRVEYFLNGESAGVVTASPWRLTLSNPQPGTYSLTATATDARGASATSASRDFTVQVNTPPTVSLTSPPNNATYFQPVALDLKANAANAETNGSIAKVEFFANGELIGTDTSKPYAIAVSTLAPGTYSLTAKATDDQGAETVSAARTVTITAQNAPPTVTLSMPANNARYNGPTADVEVRASASAPETNDAVQKVELYRDGVLVVTLTSAPYTATLAQLPVGTYVLTAVATDLQGAQATSNSRTVIIESVNRPPSVSLTAPANNSTVQTPGAVTLTANANPREVNGSITQVEFLVNGESIGVDLDKPYSATWAPTQPGVYLLTARATDNLGAETTSAARTITVVQRTSDAKLYYIHVDHLNTPRASTNDQQQLVWRWDQQEPFGNSLPDEDPSGLGAFALPLRDEGTYVDRETNLVYNVNRYRDPASGRFLQADPLGLNGGDLSLYVLRKNNPLSYTDPLGLFTPGRHYEITRRAAATSCSKVAGGLAYSVMQADFTPGSQDPANAREHAMCTPGQSPAQGARATQQFIDEQLKTCSLQGLARALHATQDKHAGGHKGCQPWPGGMPSIRHVIQDAFPGAAAGAAEAESRAVIDRFKAMCPCSVCQ